MENLKLGIHLFLRDAGLHSEDYPKAIVRTRAYLRRNVHICILPRKSDREHTDHGEELVIEADLLPENGAASREVALPE